MNDRAKITTFESYYDPMLAQIVCAKLRANRISCFIADEYMLWAKPYFNEAMGGVKIKIFEKDIEKCKQILAHTGDGVEPGDAISEVATAAAAPCPYCGSHDTRRGIATVIKFHLPSLLISVIAGIPAHIRNVWHCFNCLKEFE